MPQRLSGSVLPTVLVLIATLTAAPGSGAAPSPLEGAFDKVGAWVQPFEEGGAETPRCHPSEEGGWAKGSLICKPAAATMIGLPDGRVLYWDGLEGSENVERAGGPPL